jgi:hypothetical protein
MNTRIDNTARKGLREWWLTPPRPGLQRLINPWEYRHLGFFGTLRIAAGSVAAVAGFICLAYRVFGWAAFFLVLAAVVISFGYWEITLARSAPPRT